DVKRDEKLWFEDGTVVLIAGEDDARVAFRVYKGILERASPVFKDLFSAARPSDEEFIDDCPAVKLTDSPGELRSFLTRLIWPGLGQKKTISFAPLANVARLAHKYQADEMARAAIGRIESIFSPSKGHWIDFEHTWEEYLAQARSQCGVQFTVEDAVEAVNLARLFDRPLMLPLALYICCLEDPIRLRDGIQREDGVLERLSDEDWVRCVTAQPKLLLQCRDSVVQTFLHDSLSTQSTCFGLGICMGVTVSSMQSVLKGYMRRPGPPELSRAFTCIDNSLNRNPVAVGYRDSETHACTNCWYGDSEATPIHYRRALAEVTGVVQIVTVLRTVRCSTVYVVTPPLFPTYFSM
ncbi:hypothetical protein BV20DRAFT_954181, partial [Pilatotrama ljubarskyi]